MHGFCQILHKVFQRPHMNCYSFSFILYLFTLANVGQVLMQLITNN